MNPQNGREGTTEDKTKSLDGGHKMSDRKGIAHTENTDASQTGRPTPQYGTEAQPRKDGGGPKTALGKERSRRNAVTHGIFADVVLLKGEKSPMFRALRKGFRDDFQAVGVVEELLVEELATLKWRIRRLLDAESAEIEAERNYNFRTANREKHERMEAFLADSRKTVVMYGLSEILENPFVLKKVIHLLLSLKISILTRGFEPAEDKERITKIYGTESDANVEMLYDICSDPSLEPLPKTLGKFNLPPEERKRKFIGYIEDEIVRLRRYEKTMKERAVEQTKLEIRSGGVPEASKLDRLLRYAAMLERAFERTLNQLERLQRIRRGQPVAPTVNLHVSS
jgi:hypothetical protein